MTEAARPPGLFDLHALPEGFVYQAEFVSPAEEQLLLQAIGRLDFGEVRMHGVVARRRIVQFGWRYSFDSRALSEGHDLPSFLHDLRGRVADLCEVSAADLSEVLITEYQPGATIGWHRDAPPFDLVAGVSLASACRFRFRREDQGRWQRAELRLDPRSAYVMRGPARTAWQHSIPEVESLRYSITFRTLRASARRHRALEAQGPGSPDGVG